MLYIEKKRKYKKKNISDKINVTEKFFCSFELHTHDSFTFDLQFFYELKHKVHYFSKS